MPTLDSLTEVIEFLLERKQKCQIDKTQTNIFMATFGLFLGLKHLTFKLLYVVSLIWKISIAIFFSVIIHVLCMLYVLVGELHHYVN